MTNSKFLFLPLVIALLAALALIFITQTYGSGISHDSIVYITTARNILAGRGYISFDGFPPTLYAPLYSYLLALGAGLGQTDPQAIAPFLNVVIVAGIVLLTADLVRTIRPDARLATAITLAGLIFGVPVFGVAVMAWSEPLFLLLEVAVFLLLYKYRAKQSTGLLVAAGVLAAAAALTRYIGVVLLPSGILFILWVNRRTLWRGVLQAGLFGLIAASLFGVWLLRNYLETGTFTGARDGPSSDVPGNLLLIKQTLVSWLVPNAVSSRRWVVVGLVVAIVGIGMGAVRLNWRTVWERSRVVAPLGIWAILYLVTLLAAAAIAGFDALGSRILSPIYLPLLVFAVFVADAFAEPYRRRVSPAVVNLCLGLGAVLVLLTPAQRVTQHAARYIATGGYGYNNKIWQTSETMAYVRQMELHLHEPLYSNHWWLLALMGRESKPFPRVQKDPKLFFGDDTRDSYLVWFEMPASPPFWTPADLQARALIQPVAQLRDGAVYRMVTP